MPRKFPIEFALERHVQRGGVESLVSLMYFVAAEAEELWDETGDPRARKAADYLVKVTTGLRRAIGPWRPRKKRGVTRRRTR